VAAVLAAVLASVNVAEAQSAKASAEVLFSEGRRLMGEGKLDEACPKFADSQKLDPSSGTLLNLANCYEKQGKNASAWAIYLEAAALAASTQRADHVPVAQKRAATLLPMLAKVTVTVAKPPPGLEIRRDGVLLTRSEWGLAVPVDPGNHTYVASADGFRSASVPLSVPPTPEGGPAPALSLTIPDLQALPPEPAKPVEVVPAAPPPATPAPAHWHPRRTAGLVIGGIGVAGLAVAGGLAGLAKSTYNTSLGNCAPTDPSRCSLVGFNQRNDAIQQGNFATVAVAVGAAAVAAGVVLFATAPVAAEGPRSASVSVEMTPGGVRVSGRW
jgi:hypothetical protein